MESYLLHPCSHWASIKQPSLGSSSHTQAAGSQRREMSPFCLRWSHHAPSKLLPWGTRASNLLCRTLRRESKGEQGRKKEKGKEGEREREICLPGRFMKSPHYCMSSLLLRAYTGCPPSSSHALLIYFPHPFPSSFSPVPEAH